VSGKPKRVRFLSVPLYNAAASALEIKGPAYCRAFLHSVIIDDGS
jgi:hypothetical protein